MSSLNDVTPGWEYGEDHDLGIAVIDRDARVFTDQNYAEALDGCRQWTLVYAQLTAAEEALLITAIKDAKTGDGTTTFTPRGAGSPVTVRVLENQFRFANLGPNRRGTIIRVEEVL